MKAITVSDLTLFYEVEDKETATFIRDTLEKCVPMPKMIRGRSR